MLQTRLCFVCFLFVASWAATARSAAPSAAEEHFQRAYYAETHQDDAAAAIEAYGQVLAQADAPEALRGEAQSRLDGCREQVRAADPATLLPGTALAMIQVNRPGQHVGQLAKLLGLCGKVSDKGTDQPGADQAPAFLPLEGAFGLPERLAISPALICELSKVHGAAVAVTSIDPQGKPQAVAVIDVGNSDLVRGLLETGIQFVAPDKPIEGFRTYCVENNAWIATTHRLVIVSTSRDEIAAVIARLKGTASDDLANAAQFASLESERKDSLAFVYVAGQALAQAVRDHVHGHEAQAVRATMDLDHLKSLTAALRVTGEQLELAVKLAMTDGHHNLLHGLVQTAPITGQSLEFVPGGCAAVAVLGLNPAEMQAGQRSRPASFSLMDVGRELFGNIGEASLFVMPAAGQQPRIPEIGLVLAVGQAEQSETLWYQLLALPGAFGAPVQGPREITVDGRPAREFLVPDLPPIVLARLEGNALVVGTAGAVSAAAAARSSGQPITKDPDLQSTLAKLTPHSSKAIVVHAARVLRVIESLEPGAARDLQKVQPLVADLTALIVTDEPVNAFALRAIVAGLPDVSEAIKQLALSHRPAAPSAQQHVSTGATP